MTTPHPTRGDAQEPHVPVPLSDPLAAAASGLDAGLGGPTKPPVEDHPPVLSPNERLGIEPITYESAAAHTSAEIDPPGVATTAADEADEPDQRTPADGPTPLRDPGSTGNVKLSTLPWDLTEKPGDASMPPWFRRAVLIVFAAAVIAKILVWGFGELANFWYTLVFSFFMGLALEPIVNRLAARGMRRGLATFLVMAGLGISAVLFFLIFGNLLAEQLSQLVRSLPAMLDSVVAAVNQRFNTNLDANSLLSSLGVATSDLAKVAADLGLGLFSVLTTTVGYIFSLFTIALFSFYFAADGPNFRRTVASWMPPDRQRMFLTVWDISTQKAGGYVISRGILALISAAFHGVVFLLLDLPYWLPMALWVGLVSQFIPTIGTYLAGALPIIIALVDGSPLKALLVLAAVTLYQQVENYLVAPRVTRSTLEIHPAVAFGSVIVGSSLFGVTGALLAIPVVATIQAIVSVYGRRYTLVQEFGDLGAESEEARTEAAVRAAEVDRPTPPPRPQVPHVNRTFRH